MFDSCNSIDSTKKAARWELLKKGILFSKRAFLYLVKKKIQTCLFRVKNFLTFVTLKKSCQSFFRCGKNQPSFLPPSYLNNIFTSWNELFILHIEFGGRTAAEFADRKAIMIKLQVTVQVANLSTQGLPNENIMFCECRLVLFVGRISFTQMKNFCHQLVYDYVGVKNFPGRAAPLAWLLSPISCQGRQMQYFASFWRV